MGLEVVGLGAYGRWFRGADFSTLPGTSLRVGFQPYKCKHIKHKEQKRNPCDQTVKHQASASRLSAAKFLNIFGIVALYEVLGLGGSWLGASLGCKLHHRALPCTY